MHAHAEARGRTGLEDAAGLLGRERAALAEGVDPSRVGFASREHLADHEVDVRIGTTSRAAVVTRIGELPGNHMRSEECDLVGDLVSQPHETLFVGDTQAVARLDLEGRGALRVQFGHERRETRTQRLVGRGPSSCHGRSNSARGISLARHARGELIGPVAAEHEVRVRVDEPRDHRAAAHVHDLDVGVPERAVLLGLAAVLACVAPCKLLGRVRGRTDPGDAAVLDEHGGVADDAERSALAVGRGIVRHQFGDAGEQHPSCGPAVAHASSIGTRSPRSRATSTARS